MVASREQRQSVQVAVAEEYKPGEGRVPRLSGDIRPLVPKLGLRNYWYPMIPAKKVLAKRPAKVRMLGEEIVAFRGASGRVVALQDVCPHRGALLSEGDCHYAGTVACPYHGWVYDEHGHNVAVLSEGPESKVCGKPGTETKVYPTRTLKGVVFVWIGDEEPVPIEEDVPEEFFDKDAFIFANDEIIWETNWEVGLENSMDSHVGYLHRDSLTGLLSSPNTGARTAQGAKIAFTGNGFRNAMPGGGFNQPVAPQDIYPNGWKWPKHRFRTRWAWAFRWFFMLTRVPAPPAETIKWSGGHRLPGMFRAGGPARSQRLNGGAAPPANPNGLFGAYCRWTVAMEEWKTRVWYFHYTRPRSRVERAWFQFLYVTIYKWLSEYNFSQQDMRVMLFQKYDHPEKLSGTDSEVVQWRKLVVTKHFGGRNAPFEFKSTDGLAGEGQEAPDAEAVVPI